MLRPLQRRKIRRRLAPYLLALPALALLGLFAAGLVSGLMQSFGYIPAFGLTRFTLDYYRGVFADAQLAASVKLSLWISVSSTLISVVLGTLLCTALVRLRKVRGFTLQTVRLPIQVPHTVVALFTLCLFSQSGLLSRILAQAGLLTSQNQFPNLVFGSSGSGILLAYVWKETPFVAYFVLALMQRVSQHLDEAAATLGASPLHTFFSVTLPLSMPAILRAGLMIFAFSFGAYELPFLLGATSPKALPVQAYIEYIDPDLRHRPYAMALNGIILLLTLLLAAAFFLVTEHTAKKLGGDGHAT